MNTSRILITGGAGFIGSNFVHYWCARHPGHRVVVLDALTYAGNPASLSGLDAFAGYRFVHGDIRDRALVTDLLEQERIDTVVHFAAESHVDRSIHGPDVFIDTNVLGTHTLLKAAHEVWSGAGPDPARYRFHHVSTDEVYGSLELEDAPFTEESPYNPSSPYAASKAASDHLVRAYHRTYGLPVTISNCSNNYGPRHFPEKLIPLMTVNALQGKPLPIYGSGRNVRDWLHVEDHCRGIEAILLHGANGRTYNIGGNCERTNSEIVETLCAELDRRFASEAALRERFPECPAASGESTQSLVRHVKDRPGHDLRYAINAERMRRELGFRPEHTLQTGLKQTVGWYLENEDWWHRVLDGSYAQWIEKQYG